MISSLLLADELLERGHQRLAPAPAPPPRTPPRSTSSLLTVSIVCSKRCLTSIRLLAQRRDSSASGAAACLQQLAAPPARPARASARRPRGRPAAARAASTCRSGSRASTRPAVIVLQRYAAGRRAQRLRGPRLPNLAVEPRETAGERGDDVRVGAAEGDRLQQLLERDGRLALQRLRVGQVCLAQTRRSPR